MGVAITTAIKTMIKLPKIAFLRPPSAFGGGVFCVNRLKLKEARPL
jgi:hypothetical protein